MLKRVINFPLVSAVCLSFLPMYACSTGGNDEGQFTFGSFGTTQTTTLSTTNDSAEEESESGDGDGDGDTTGDGDGDGDTNGDGDGDTNGDGDGDPSAGDGDGDDSCPPGEFGCPCINGQCAPGLTCQGDNTCGLGGGDGDGDNSTGDGDGDPWDPDACVDPSIPVTINGIEGSLCSAPCAVDGDCPAGPPGTQPACALILDMAVDPTNCALICDPVNDTCPVGSSCKDVPNQPGVGICTYP
jgi:hypothetical protein